MNKYLYAEYAVVNFGTDLGQGIQQLDNKQWIRKNKVLGLITFSVDFGSQRIECLGDRNILEVTDFSRFRTPKKLELNWMAKRMSGDSCTICNERI